VTEDDDVDATRAPGGVNGKPKVQNPQLTTSHPTPEDQNLKPETRNLK